MSERLSDRRNVCILFRKQIYLYFTSESITSVLSVIFQYQIWFACLCFPKIHSIKTHSIIIMHFYDENNKKIDHANIEIEEQLLVNQFVEPHHVVLELGARYGTVSCAINKKLANKSMQVSVEPDSRIWTSLETNKQRNNCKFHIVKGVISRKPLELTNLDYCDGYGTTSNTCSESTIPSYTLENIQAIYNLEFNCLVVDCEGCLEMFLDDNPSFLDQLELLIFEADYSNKCNYNKIRQLLRTKTFTELKTGHQNVWKKTKTI